MRLALLLVWLACGSLCAQEPVRQEISSNFAPAELLKPAIQAVLSAEGRFVILPEKGAVLIIDQPEGVAAAAEAIRNLNVPPPVLELSVGVRTGGVIQANPAPALDPFANPVRSGRDFLFPTELAPPRVMIQPNASYVIIPATPTRFGRGALGTTLESQEFPNPDGSVTMNVSYQNVDFVGFINYGSRVLPFGMTGTIPMQTRLPRPTAIGPFLNNGTVQLPVFDTTRISTSVLVHPERDGNKVSLQLLPQISVSDEKNRAGEQIHQFREFRTKVDLANGKVATLRGFRDAPDTFNEVFFGDEENPTGRTELVLKGRIVPGTPQESP